MSLISQDNLNRRLQQRITKEIGEEYNKEIVLLKKRKDYSKEFEYFLDILSLSVSPSKFKERFNISLIGSYCIQTPVELFDAFDFHPIRLCRGSLSMHKLFSHSLPALTCPVMKSCVGAFYLDKSLETLCDIIVVPTTCDWIANLPKTVKSRKLFLHIMELPHIKESERGQKRWLEEVYELKRTLEKHTGRKLKRKKLLLSIDKYNKACILFGELIELKRKGLISGTWSIVLANAFMLDNVESWMLKINEVIKNCKNSSYERKPKIFLAGSPLFFPYFKIAELIEETGMHIAADELCTSERILKNVIYDESSEYGLIKALAERYQLSCSCPTFTDNERRVKNVIATMHDYNIKGVVYHLLKGCHPYDIESFHFEKIVKKEGFKFIKIETDYSREDKENILSRLEAFKETLHYNKG